MTSPSFPPIQSTPAPDCSSVLFKTSSSSSPFLPPRHRCSLSLAPRSSLYSRPTRLTAFVHLSLYVCTYTSPLTQPGTRTRCVYTAWLTYNGTVPSAAPTRCTQLWGNCHHLGRTHVYVCARRKRTCARNTRFANTRRCFAHRRRVVQGVPFRIVSFTLSGELFLGKLSREWFFPFFFLFKN